MLRTLLAGRDGPKRTALPAGEFLHPVPLLALLALIANDWWLKPSGLAPLIAGKLSDFAGLLFFPLLLTALFDCLLLVLFRLGSSLDFSLRRWKLALSILVTGVCFSAIKLVPAINALALDLAHRVGLAARIALDPSDLFALPALWIAWRLGLAEIRRLPLGRLEVLRRRSLSKQGAGDFLRDLLAVGADPTAIAQLIEALEAHRQNSSESTHSALERSLARLREPSAPSFHLSN